MPRQDRIGYLEAETSPPSHAQQSFHTSSCERVARLPAARPTELQFLRARKRASQSQERLAATPYASTHIVTSSSID
jgi:hypothetical protein